MGRRGEVRGEKAKRARRQETKGGRRGEGKREMMEKEWSTAAYKVHSLHTVHQGVRISKRERQMSSELYPLRCYTLWHLIPL